MYHETPGYMYNSNGIMQQRDGNFILNSYIFQKTGSWQTTPLGNTLYKISPTDLVITDTLFIADTNPISYVFLTQNPSSEDNIRASYEYREDCDSTFLRISRFQDDDLLGNPEEDVVMPMCDGFAYGNLHSLVDCWGDMIMVYVKDRPDLCLDCYDSYAIRVSPDGLLKQQVLMTFNGFKETNDMRIFKDSPLQYYTWGKPDDPGNPNLAVCVIDSLFNANVMVINRVFYEEIIDQSTIVYKYFSRNGDTQIIPADGDNILVAAEYVGDTNFHSTAEYGVAVAKYDLRTMQQKGYIVFDDHSGGHLGQAEVMEIKMMSDGTVYFLYKENGYPSESVLIVKMDTDLNVDWKRFCKTENIDIYPMFGHSSLFKNEQGEEQGLVWLGIGRTTSNSNYDGLALFLLNHDGPVNVADQAGITVRPYGFYPNPAKDRLRMEFSPDVQPARVELYDLQGRLVRSQRSAFESINMSQLPAGTYMMRVTMEDGTAYSDKVVKELK